jgi:hypothetical protein
VKSAVAFLVVAAVVAGARAAGSPASADPSAAEKQYRLAQRLGADRSPDAPAAFEKVVALAPAGPYADDALVDLARMHGAPEWPEELGELSAARAALARAPLEKAVSGYPDGDRAGEAKYRLALVRLAPLPGRDPARARQDLIALAASAPRDRWPIAARYVLGALDEQGGALDRAARAFARVVIERPGGDVAARAKAGYARTLMIAGRFGEAAAWFQEAVDGGVPAASRAGQGRTLAVREVLRARVPGKQWTAVSAPLPAITTTKGATLIASGADGRTVVFDRKTDAVQAFDAKGTGATPISLPDVSAMASDPYGRIFAATKEALVRVDGASVVTIVGLGGFGSPAAIAVDASGSIWLADRKGDRIGRWAIGSPAPQLVRESRGAGVTALAVFDGRLLAAEEKAGRIVALSASGEETVFATTAFRRPVALCVDGAGRVSVLDEKAETVTRLTAEGHVSDTLSTARAGIARPVALAAARDGTVLILDAASGSLVAAP